MDIIKYYMDLETALRNTQSMINQFEIKATDEFDDTVNYAEALNSLYALESYILQLLSIHKYKGFSREEFIEFYQSSGKNYFIAEHNVKDYETLSSIAQQYNMGLDELMSINNVISDEVTAGSVLKVRINKDVMMSNNSSEVEVPVIGSRLGQNIYGTDWLNSLVEGEDGDFKSLEPLECLKQGMVNRLITREGDYPLEEDFGISLAGTEELPTDLSKAMLTVEITQQLANDLRIEKIENVSISSNKNGIDLEVAAKAIRGEENILVST